MSLIYLASQSPRRRQLLDQLGVAHELLLPGADEDAEALEAVQAGELPDPYVRRATLNKLAAAVARRAARGLVPRPILCSDTTVALGSSILGKPADTEEAMLMLRRFSGHTHRVLTAVSVGVPGRRSGAAPRIAQALSVSTVTFAPLSRSQIDRYVATGEPMGKAGAYALQGQAALWVSRMTGSHSGIVGLPAFETAQVLRAAGIPLY